MQKITFSCTKRKFIWETKYVMNKTHITKYFRCRKNTFLLGYKTEYGVWHERTVEGSWLIKTQAVSNASDQNLWGTFMWNNKVHATNKWRFLRSAMPFCWGVATLEVWWIIPLSTHNLETAEWRNSRALLERKILTDIENWVFISLKKDWITIGTFDRTFNKYNQVTQEKSSTKLKKYRKP